MLRNSLVRLARFGHVQMGPADPILGLTVAYNEDKDPKKVNLGVGAYRDDNGKPFVLSCVREAEARVSGKMDHEYAGITGVPSFVKVAQELLFGADSPALKENRVCSSQAISGTGALRVAGQWLQRHYREEPATDLKINLPTPTWGNHNPIFKDSGLVLNQYSYYDAKTCGLDFDKMMADIEALEEGSVVLFHACAHNPTGVDPTDDQWRAISDLMKRKKHYTFFDCAYQGFASGSPEHDAFAVRHFIAEGHEMIVTQSFAKNIGLYGERTGAIHIVCSSSEERAKVDSRLKMLIRPMYSNPPIYGARLVATIFEDPALRADWEREVKLMADRIIGMRKALVDELAALGSTKDWSHVEKQIGMFCYTGLTKDQVAKVISEHHVYLTGDGRISMAGVTTGNVKHVANALHQVTK